MLNELHCFDLALGLSLFPANSAQLLQIVFQLSPVIYQLHNELSIIQLQSVSLLQHGRIYWLISVHLANLRLLIQVVSSLVA